MQVSLRKRLITLLIPALLGALVVGAGWTYIVGQRAAALAYDQALMASAGDVAIGMRFLNGQPHFEMSEQSEQMLRTDTSDQIFFAVRLRDGRFVAGDADLNRAPVVRLGDGGSIDMNFRGKHVRALSMQFEQDHSFFIVTVAETLQKRRDMAWSILGFMAIPAMLLLCVAGLTVWIVVASVLKPLSILEQDLAMRTEGDLSLLEPNHVPQEVRSLVRALNRLLERVSMAAQVQQSFVADAAHQLRTPLAALQTQIDLLGEKALDSHSLESLRYTVERAVRLAHQLLSLAKSERDVATLNMREFDVAALVAGLADDWVHRAIKADIDLGFELEPAMLFGDEVLIGEMLENLVGNALNYTGRGGTITVSTVPDGDELVICVDDSGPGIPQSERLRVFERFYRLPGSGSGSGLGLAIVQQIASRHQGQVEILNSVLGGARICVRFPTQYRRTPGTN